MICTLDFFQYSVLLPIGFSYSNSVALKSFISNKYTNKFYLVFQFCCSTFEFFGFVVCDVCKWFVYTILAWNTIFWIKILPFCLSQLHVCELFIWRSSQWAKARSDKLAKGKNFYLRYYILQPSRIYRSLATFDLGTIFLSSHCLLTQLF